MFRIRPFERTEIENKAVAEIQSVAWSNCLNSVAMWNRTDSACAIRALWCSVLWLLIRVILLGWQF